jgi:hypothetical protein
MSLDGFNLFLEASGPGGETRARLLGISPAEISKLREVYVSLIRLGTAKEAILAALGTPAIDDASSFSYELPGKPGYLFRFSFDASGLLTGARYVQRVLGTRTFPGPLSRQTIKSLGAMGATEEEIRAWYGDPDEITGWWPVETWSYGELHFDLRLGIVA